MNMNINNKLKKVCGVYYFKFNNKLYIGASINVYERLRDHNSRLKNNKHFEIIQLEYNKSIHNKIETGLLIQCNEDELVKWEQYYILLHNPYFNTIQYKYCRKKKSQQLRDLIKEQVTERFYNNNSFSKVVESQRKPVYVYNSITLEIIKYESQTKCAEILNIGRKIVRNRLKTMNSYNSLYFSYINEFSNK